MFTLFLALACAPAIPTIGGDSTVRNADPGTVSYDTAATSPTRPVFTIKLTRPLAGTAVSSCFDDVAWLIVQVDTNGEGRNDEVEQMELSFDTGATATTHNSATETSLGTDNIIRFMTSSLSNELLAVYGDVWLYDEFGNLLGQLEPALADPWVTWNCPP